MKAELIRSENSYILKDGLNHVLGIDDKKLKDRLECPYLLSKQNCDEIFGVVDLDVLATEHYKEYDNLPVIRYNSFTTGFNKAMEFNKDKLFTMEQMNRAIHLACSEYSGNIIDEVTQQPTEIDVVIEHYDFELLGKPMGRRVFKPNLDSEGCLILKRK